MSSCAIPQWSLRYGHGGAAERLADLGSEVGSQGRGISRLSYVLSTEQPRAPIQGHSNLWQYVDGTNTI